MHKHLHIVSFTVPYPPDYGGVFDLFYKIRALHEAGIKIHLHCFTTGIVQPVLKKYCEQVFYYRRNTGLSGISLTLPYIVRSRINQELVERIKQDDYPVLIEGIHGSGLLLNLPPGRRKVALRLHNVEHLYYDALYHSSISPLKQVYYKAESILLKKYEPGILQRADRIFTVSAKDEQYCKDVMKVQNVTTLPVFTDFTFDVLPGTGNYCLYHGNLSVSENEKAVRWLSKHVFDSIDVPLIVAGKNPSDNLKQLITAYKNIRLVSNPSDEELRKLLSNAQCHVLPSENATGVKLKLIHALYKGRHCIVNRAAVEGSSLESLCNVSDGDAIREKVMELFNEPVTEDLLDHRRTELTRIFDTKKLAKELIQWLW